MHGNKRPASCNTVNFEKVNVEILKTHLNHCIKESFESCDDKVKQEKIDEMTNLLDKILK